MANRYDILTVGINSDGKQVYTKAMLTTIKISVSDPQIICNEMTRLDLLAYQYLGNQSLWWMIASANGIGNGSLHVKPGTVLTIPVSAMNP